MQIYNKCLTTAEAKYIACQSSVTTNTITV